MMGLSAASEATAYKSLLLSCLTKNPIPAQQEIHQYYKENNDKALSIVSGKTDTATRKEEMIL